MTPTDVFSAAWELNQLADRLLTGRGLKAPRARILVKSAAPMHVYQAHLTCIDSLHALQLSTGVVPIPIVSSTPRAYTPEDVIQLTTLMRAHLVDLAARQGLATTVDVPEFEKKTPLEVFGLIFHLQKKINKLRGIDEFSPSLVFQEARRAVDDLKNMVKAVPSRQGESSRALRWLRSAGFGLDPSGGRLEQVSEPKLPRDAFQACLDLRRSLVTLKDLYDLPTAEVYLPSAEELATITPSDVFIQTQFILSELNLLKSPMGISNGTPRAVAAENKTPRDVCQQARFADYMVERLIHNAQ